MERVPPEKIEEMEYMLSRPLPGEENKVSDAMIEDEGASFMALHTGASD